MAAANKGSGSALTLTLPLALALFGTLSVRCARIIAVLPCCVESLARKRTYLNALNLYETMKMLQLSNQNAVSAF